MLAGFIAPPAIVAATRGMIMGDAGDLDGNVLSV